MNLGAPEILLILVVALLIFGPQRLPEIGRQVGGAMRELRRMQDSVKSELHSALQETAPQYPTEGSAPLPEAAFGDGAPSAPREENDPDRRSSPDLPARDPGFDGPSGSFR
jgi:sec-independent protein translocase protein TatA